MGTGEAVEDELEVLVVLAEKLVATVVGLAAAMVAVGMAAVLQVVLSPEVGLRAQR
jgi:biopolymer transport protein ExbB/TolQ